MEQVAARLNNYNIEEVLISSFVKSSLYVKPDHSMMYYPPTVKKIWVVSAGMPWTQLGSLMRHFHLNSTYPQPQNNQQVMEQLGIGRVQGLELQYNNDIGTEADDDHSDGSGDFEFNDDDDDRNNTDSTEPLRTIRGLDTVNSLMLGIPPFAFYLDGIPTVLQDYLWPELRYLRLCVKHFNSTQILSLKETAPKLNYLELWVYADNIPDAVWMFDWDSLSWRTGFYVEDGWGTSLDLRGRISLHKIAPIYLYLDSSNSIFNIDLSENGLTSLDYIKFSYRYLDIYGLVDNQGDITFKLDHNRLRSLSIYSRINEGADRVRVLNLSHNRLQGDDSDFLLLTGLRELYLSYNNYDKLPQFTLEGQKKIFHRVSDLRELTILDLSHNHIHVDSASYHLPGGPFGDLSCDAHSPIETMLLHNNSIQAIPEFVFISSLSYIDLSYNGMTEWPIIYTEKMNQISDHYNHTAINLSHNNITQVWPSVYNLPLKRIMENYDIDLEGNPLDCDCGTYSLYKFLTSSTNDFSFYETRWNCTDLSKWKGKPLMQIPKKEYHKACIDTCPEQCNCSKRWEGDGAMIVNCTEHVLTELPATVPDSTSHLFLQNNNITYLCETWPYFKDLEVLDLHGNSLNKICPEFFHNLVNLKKLNVKNNNLKELPEEFKLLTNLKHLSLSNNLLEELPKSLSEMNLESIDISGNRLKCNCDNLWMTKWLLKSLFAVSEPQSIVCVSGKGQGRRLIDLDQDEVGCYDLVTHGLIGLAATFTVTIILAILIHRYKGYIKLWLYTRFGIHIWDKIEETNLKDMDYDAFIAYSRKDERWVLDTLMPHLEAPQCGFHLCIHDRDFVPGVAILENIGTAVEHSCRTILVVSPNFLKSGWCDYEFKMAHSRATDKQANYLIVVVLEDIANKKVNKALKLYLKTNTYVSVKDKWFWDKLKYALPKVPIDQLKAEQKERAQKRNKAGPRVVVHQNQAFGENELEEVVTEPNPDPVVDDEALEGEELLGASGGRPKVQEVPRAGRKSDLELELTDDYLEPLLHRRRHHDDRSDDVITDSDDEEEFQKDQVYKRKRRYVSKLPPLFRRIHIFDKFAKNVPLEVQLKRPGKSRTSQL